MPFIDDALPTSATGSLSPLQAHLGEIIISCSCILKRIASMKDDMNTFGFLAEDTYCYDIPELLVHMQRVSRIAAICTRAITSTDALPEVVNEELAGSLHDFLSQHRRILDDLTALKTILQSTGSLYSVLGADLHRKDTILKNMREAIDSNYPIVQIQTAADWVDHKAAVEACLQAYPIPLEAWERNY